MLFPWIQVEKWVQTRKDFGLSSKKCFLCEKNIKKLDPKSSIGILQIEKQSNELICFDCAKTIDWPGSDYV